MNVADFDENFPDVELQKSDVKLKSYTGDKITVVGEAVLNVVEKGIDFELPIVVTKVGPTVIGRIWINAFAQVDSLPVNSDVHTVIDSHLYDDIVYENLTVR